MRKSLIAGAVAVGLASVAISTQAATVVGTIPMGANQNNQVIAPLTLIEGWYGANVYLIGGPATIEAKLIGREAGNTNSFHWGGNQIFSLGGGTSGTLSAPLAGIDTFNNVASGLLNFEFKTSAGGAAANVKNGENDEPNNNNGNFFVTFTNSTDFNTIDQVKNNSTAGGGTTAWLFYDDLGAGPDDNHDDLVLRLTITSGGSFTVPEPTSLGLVGASLLGLGIASRRRRKA